MSPKLKEDPREWCKFTLVMAGVLGAVGYAAFRRQWLPRTGLVVVLTVLFGAFLLCCWRPRWFRGFYRRGMTVSFHIGQFLGRVLLVLFFLLAVTPLGLILRLAGKDLLKMKKDPDVTTYWHPAKSNRDFDRLF